MIIGISFTKFLFFMPIGNPRWLPPQVIVLTHDHMGKYRNIFFPEAIALIEPKLCINHWKVLYKLCVVYVDRNSKMTTTAGHSSYIGPIGFFFITRWTIQALESLWCIYVLPGDEYRMIFFYINYWISALIFVWKFLKIALIF